MSYSSLIDHKRSLVSTCSTFAISTNVSNDGCVRLVHHFEIVASPLPSCSASHLFVRCCSAKTTFILFNPLTLAILLYFYRFKSNNFPYKQQKTSNKIAFLGKSFSWYFQTLSLTIEGLFPITRKDLKLKESHYNNCALHLLSNKTTLIQASQSRFCYYVRIVHRTLGC